MIKLDSEIANAWGVRLSGWETLIPAGGRPMHLVKAKARRRGDLKLNVILETRPGRRLKIASLTASRHPVPGETRWFPGPGVKVGVVGRTLTLSGPANQFAIFGKLVPGTESFDAVGETLVKLGFQCALLDEARRARIGSRVGGSSLLIAGTLVGTLNDPDEMYAVLFTERARDPRGNDGLRPKVEIVARLCEMWEGQGVDWQTTGPNGDFTPLSEILNAGDADRDPGLSLEALGLNSSVVDAAGQIRPV